MSGINHFDRARIAWTILTDVARRRTTVTYKALGIQMGVHHRAVRHALSPIQDYCLESSFPPFSILVVNATGKPGSGFIAHDTNDLETGLDSVWNFNWTAMPNPFDFAAEGLSYDSIIRTLVQQPDESGTVYVKVKTRGIQQILFRDAVRKAYRYRCAFTGLQFPDALEACHIIPWAYATPQERMDVRNGILLNPLHHRLFDKAYITINTDYKMRFWDPDGIHGEYSNLEASMTIDLHNKTMNLPTAKISRPLPQYIHRHNELLEFDSK